MTFLLFESLPALLASLVAFQFLLVAWWSWRRTRAAGRAVWIGFTATPLLLVLSLLVVTPRERLRNICQAIAAHAELGEVEAIGRYFADDLDADGWDRDRLLDQVDRLLNRYRVEQTRISRFEVTSVDHDLAAEFIATCDVSTREGELQRLPTAWRLTFRRQGDHWIIARVESIPIPPLQIRDLNDLMRR